MAWYKTGTVAVAATKVTGTGTNFLDAKFGVGPGQAFLLPASGTVKIYEIASVEDAAHLTLTTSAGTVAAGAAYAVMSFYTDSIPDFSKRLAAQLGYYQSQMDGWQQIMTGTDAVNVTAPDGAVVNISSFSKLTADMAAAFKIRGAITTAIDLNTYGPTVDFIGKWRFSTVAGYQSANLPEVSAGVLDVINGGDYGGMQKYTSTKGFVWVRPLVAAWSAGSPNVWGDWRPVGYSSMKSSVVDLNTLIIPNIYSCAAAVLNKPPSVTVGGRCVVMDHNSAGNISQIYYTATSNASQTNRVFMRFGDGTTWTDWAEMFTSKSIIPLANGGTGAPNAAAARAALGLTLQTSLTDTTAGRVTTVGSFGVGANTPTSVILDGVKPGGLYNAQAALGGIGNNSSLLQVPYDTNTGYQIIIPTILASAPKMFLRVISTTTQYNGQICEVYTTTNTTKGSGGVLSAASPVARIVLSKGISTRPDIDEDTFEWCGDGVANHEAKGIKIERVDVGVYMVTGSLGFAKDSWHLKAPADPAGNGELGIVEGEEAEDGTLTIKLFKKRYKLNEETGDIDLIQGVPMDVPANSWIDVRMEMPAAEIPDLPISEPEPTT